jgi:cytochrome c oxidase subunit 1
MFYLGLQGMPRRYYDYLEQFHATNILSTLGSWVMTFGLAITIINLFRSAKSGPLTGNNPWNGKTLEWTIPSPPPVENFETTPVYGEKDGPYEY